MVQVKKEDVRESILRNAFILFSQKGYVGTTLSMIARMSGITSGNIYRYFDSKLDIFFTLFADWFTAHIDDLAKRAGRIDDARKRLMLIILTLWRDIPKADDGFNNCLIEALSVSDLKDGYTRQLLIDTERIVSDLILDALPPERRALVDGKVLAHVLVMASDGFAVNEKLNSLPHPVESAAVLMCDLLLGDRARNGASA